MTNLSPQAQAIVDAYENTTDKYDALAAVLRALVIEVLISKYQYADWEMVDIIQEEIQAIAEELEQI